MKKVDTAYIICYGRKFDTMEEDTKALNRLKTFCATYKKNIGDSNLEFIMGTSQASGKLKGKMGYDKSKRNGGKKQFICAQKICMTNPETGERKRVLADAKCQPHLHAMVRGLGASSAADKVVDYLNRNNKGYKFSKTHLKTDKDVSNYYAYIERQSEKFWVV